MTRLFVGLSKALAKQVSKTMKLSQKVGPLAAEPFPKLLGEIGSMGARELKDIIKFSKKDVPHPIMERRHGGFSAFWELQMTGFMNCKAKETMLEVAFYYNGI
jgi:hypothetical protein